MWSRTERLWLLFDAGRWDEIVADDGPAAASGADAHGEVQASTVASTFQARVLSHRGDARPRGGAHGAGRCPVAEEIDDLQVLAPALFVSALADAAAGDPAAAARRSLRSVPRRHGGGTTRVPRDPPAGGRAARARAGRPELWRRRCVERLEVHEPRMERALAAAQRDDRRTRGTHRRCRRRLREGRRQRGTAWAMPFEQAHAHGRPRTLPPIARSRPPKPTPPTRRPPACSCSWGSPDRHPLNRCSAAFVVEVAGFEPACSSD